MKNRSFNAMGLTPLSDYEISSINGGFPWPNLRPISKAIAFVAMFMITEPLNELGKGISKGLNDSMKK